ncbi:MAG: DUF5686 and carboxypeptidase regulatory-like domain-containing protein [Saprospiraceae bacterium]|nr:DUF5686 and carboxypeptidase regulatory-like domain-containing protein [Saprospiraceae bacterium]
MKQFILSTLGLAMALQVSAQVLTGTVTDENNTPLPYATIYVPELTRGTATNEEGYYSLRLPRGTHTVIFQYLGYQSREEVVRINGNQRLDVSLQTEPIQLENVTITGDREDPAYTIMRKAIAKAKYHTQQIDTYQATVYIKGSGRLKGLPGLFRKRLEKELAKEGIDTATAFTTESVSELIYRRPNQYEEKVISVRTVGDDNNTSPVGFLKGSFYEPEINNAVSPLSPRAFAYYRFEYLGEFTDRGHTINKIRVTPRSRGENVFEGTLYIVDQLWSIHSLDLNMYLWGILFNINQVYAPIEEGVWLPINNIFNVSGQFFGFKFEYQYFANMSEYDITLNPDLDFYVEVIDDKLEKEAAQSADEKLRLREHDSALEALGQGEELSRKSLRKLLKEYEKQERTEWQQDTLENVVEVTRQTVDSMAYRRDSSYWERIRPVPLTPYEQKGYRVMDSIARAEALEEQAAEDSISVTVGTQTGARISGRSRSHFQIKDLLLGGSYKLNDRTRFAIQSPLTTLQFNTVDGYNAEWGVRLSHRGGADWSVAPSVRYNFARGNLNYRVRNSLTGGPRFSKWALVLEGGNFVSQLNRDEPIHPAVNTMMSLFFERNYLRQYEKDFVLVGFQKALSSKLRFSLEAEWARNRMLLNNSDFVVFGSDKRSYMSNVPYSAEIGDTGFPDYRSTTLRFDVVARPWIKYRIYNGHKSLINNSSPTLTFGLRAGLNGLFDSEVDYQLAEIGFKHDLAFAGGGVLSLNVIGGAFLNAGKLYFPDFKHFLGNRTPFATTDPAASFRMLDYYTFSTADKYAQVFAHYQFRKLLFTHLLEVRLMGIKENVFVNVLETRSSDHYVELGYGLNYILRVFRLEFVTAWQDFTYRDFAVRIGIATNLDTLFD